MKNTYLILILLISCSILTACRFSVRITDSGPGTIKSSGNLRTEQRTAGEFTGVHSSGGIEVFITEGSGEKVEVSADAAFLPYIQTEVSGGTLLVSRRPNIRFSSNANIRVYLEMVKISELLSTSGSAIRSRSPLTAGDITLKASSGSSINLELTANNINMTVSSGSAVSLIGKAAVLETSISSGSQLSASELSVDSYDINLSSGSEASIKVTNRLAYSVSSGSRLTCSGSPKITSAQVSSGGSFSMR